MNKSNIYERCTSSCMYSGHICTDCGGCSIHIPGKKCLPCQSGHEYYLKKQVHYYIPVDDNRHINKIWNISIIFFLIGIFVFILSLK